MKNKNDWVIVEVVEIVDYKMIKLCTYKEIVIEEKIKIKGRLCDNYIYLQKLMLF